MSFSVELPFDRTILYLPTDLEHLEADELVEFIEEYTGLPVELRDDFFREYYHEDLPRRLAFARVRDLTERRFIEPLPVEVDLEEKIIHGRNVRGIIYDGRRLTKMMREYTAPAEGHHVVITDRTVGTMEEHDARYHIRTLVCSIPSLISTSGIVEGPAKPREYYTGLKSDLGFEPMEYGDTRMTDAVKSYLLQSLAWRITGEPFCEDKGCRLHNPHWQEELVEYQLKGKLCDEHLKLFREFQNFIYSKDDASI